LIVIDSSCWLAFFLGHPLAARVERHLTQETILVPAIAIYEVYKVLRRDLDEDTALAAVARMREYIVVPLDDSIALEAADFSLQAKLPLADAVIYATAQQHEAEVLTMDQHFQRLPGVKYLDG
jgi:predicted nucleic acid-binding protein